MDLNALMSTMLSGDSVAGLGQKTGASQAEVTNVLGAALPALLNGAKGQADGADTVSGFAGALASHAKDDTSDLSAFLSNVDLEDGGKIIGHLLGGAKDDTTQAAAQRAGVDVKKSGSILSAAAPLLMSLLGQQTQAQQQEQGGGLDLGGLFGSLLGGGGGGGLDLGGLLGGGSSAGNGGGLDLGGLLGGILGGK